MRMSDTKIGIPATISKNNKSTHSSNIAFMSFSKGALIALVSK